jgi:GNAT superfamily N-acetyltransferase
MTVTIKEISKPSEIKQFVKFGNKHYKGNPYYVPTLVLEESDTLNPKKNPVFEFCDHVYYMAYKDGKTVGRIAGMINRRANETWNQNRARFGWIEFTDDLEVSSALLKAVEDWAAKKGADSIHGPMGFTDLDHEGMLIEGFDQLGTMATIYNYDYYPVHMEKAGYEKDSDWVEFRITIPNSIPERYSRIAEIVQKKYQLNVLKFKRSKDVLKYGQRIFELLNESFSPLYGYVPLTQKQIDYYIKIYISMLRPDLITLITDPDDNLICFGISIPSMSEALQKSGGKLLPFGFIHLLRTLKGKVKNDTVDLYLIAVRPDFQGKGVNSLLFCDLIPTCYESGFRYAETNIELETNTKVQSQWEIFEHRLHKRRRAYIKELKIKS